jgi:hypothetical protein
MIWVKKTKIRLLNTLNFYHDYRGGWRNRKLKHRWIEADNPFLGVLLLIDMANKKETCLANKFTVEIIIWLILTSHLTIRRQTACH